MRTCSFRNICLRSLSPMPWTEWTTIQSRDRADPINTSPCSLGVRT